jgi:hypothetical protein
VTEERSEGDREKRGRYREKRWREKVRQRQEGDT